MLKNTQMSEMSNKVALVSGGARGMGAEEVRLLVWEGAKVVFGDIVDNEGKQLAEELGDSVRFVHLDVTKSEDWNKAVETAEKEFGHVNVLINNAEIIDNGAFEEYTAEQFNKILDVNLIGTFNGMKAVTSSMKEAKGGSIINISSTAGMTGYPLISGYAASKWAVRGLTKSVALELGKYNIRVNSVHPGRVQTHMDDNNEMKTLHIALNRLGQPKEIADVVLFLAGDESSFITGTEIVVDGGEIAGITEE